MIQCWVYLYFIFFLTALSILQNGCMPSFMSEEILNQVFSTEDPGNPSLRNLRFGLDTLGLVRVSLKKISIICSSPGPQGHVSCCQSFAYSTSSEPNSLKLCRNGLYGMLQLASNYPYFRAICQKNMTAVTKNRISE